MSTERKGLEVLVGLFLLIGFGCLGAIVVFFGKVGGGLDKSYSMTVEFPNASGLIKGSDVLLAGAHVGRVADAPRLISGSFRVEARLEISERVRIPRGATFLVGSSGLLGDRFVDVHLKPGFDPAETYQPGERVTGLRSGGIDELANKGGAVIDQLSAELEHIQLMTARLNDGLLHERNLKNIEATFDNLRAATEKFKETSQNLETLVGKAGATLEAANATMKTANGAATDLRTTIADLHKTIDAAAKTVDATSTLVKKASEGGGPLGMLINDRKMADDLKSFVTNLRRSGVLFYKDRLPTAPPGAAATPAPAPRH